MERKLAAGLLIVISFCIVVFFYHKIILAPNDVIFSEHRDGIKNYYTFYYHIVHDASYINFAGMNYPYGEHFLYTDCHPILANCLKFVAHYVPWVSLHCIGILNSLMIASVFMTFIVVYLLLLEFKIRPWIALLYTIGIGLLAPQVFRMGGHLALSYSIAFPLSWLLIIRAKTNLLKYSLLLLINNIVWLFVHAYLGLIVIFFQAVYLIVNAVTNRGYRKQGMYYVHFFAVIVLPLMSFYLFALFTDTHKGRTDNPSGFFLHNAELDDVFLPSQAPLRPFLDHLLGPVIHLKWEAQSYVGLPSTLVFLALLIFSLICLLKKRLRSNLPIFFDDAVLRNSLIAAFVVLLFAMAIPFKQLPGLLNFFPLIKQFRATGRFTWPFFFVASVFAAHVSQKVFLYYKNRNHSLIAFVLILGAPFILILEGLPYHTATAEMISKTGNLFKKESLSDSYKAGLKAINPSMFQAILPLPFFYLGSENFSRFGAENTARIAMVLSSHWGLPLLAANLTRTSIPESKKLVQLISPAFYKKDIEKDLNSNQEILILTANDSLTYWEKTYLSTAKQLYKSETFCLYALKKEALFRNPAISYFNKFDSLHRGTNVLGRFISDKKNTFFFYNSFEQHKTKFAYRGTGAFSGLKAGKNVFASFEPGTFETGKDYDVSLWMYNHLKDGLNDWLRFVIEEYDAEANTWMETTYYPEFCEVIDGKWSLMEGRFRVHNAKNKIFIVSKGKEHTNSMLYADDILVKETGTNLQGQLLK